MDSDQQRLLVWDGLFDFIWRLRDQNRGKNDFLLKWARLGFVSPQRVGEVTVLVEKGRQKYDLMNFRDYFFHLMNMEKFSDFENTARRLAEEYLAQGRNAGESFVGDPENEQYSYFDYDAVTFAARMEKIYNTEKRKAEQYNPTSPVEEPLFRTAEHVVERIRQLAPFNQLDGSWLERATKAGPIIEVNAFLFEIWSDEIGNGDPAQNHANIYTDLMHSAGIYMPPLNSRAYADNLDVWDASFSSPAYQSAIARFPETYFPELLGMTLYLEWEAIYLPAMVKLYEYHGFPSLFYKLHVAIDNPVNGHGARARDAVNLYLDHVRAEGGDSEVQAHWRRIWTGYLAFRFGGFDEWRYRLTNPIPVFDLMVALVNQKKHYGQLNHHSLRFGPNLINDLFDEPDIFLTELSRSDLIVRGDAKSSPIFGLMSQTGPMLKVFSAKDKALWTEWINSMAKDPAGAALSPASAMVVLLTKLTPRGTAVPAHGSEELTGEFRDPAKKGKLTKVTKPVSWWFQIEQPDRFMAALADPANGWVLPRNPQGSRLVTALITSTNKMARFLARPVPELGGKPARNVIIDWIADGCNLPPAGPPTPPFSALAIRRAMSAAPPTHCEQAAPEDHARIVRQSSSGQALTAEQARGLQIRIYGPRGGAAH